MVEPYYKDTLVEIWHGDCRELLPSLPKVDLVLTDPPYGVGIGGGHIDPRKNGHGLGRTQAYASHDDTYENLVSIIIPRFTEFLTITDRAIVFTGRYIQQYPSADAIGGIYIPAACGRHQWGFNTLSPILFYGKAPDLNKGMRHVVLVSSATSDKVAHPCPKPTAWMRWAVNLGSRESELICDPFMGSGTTLRAAKELNRKAIGIEIEERYCEIAAKRCESIQAGLFDATVVPVVHDPQTAFFGD